MKNARIRIAYRTGVAIGLLAFLLTRSADLLDGTASSVDVLAAAVFLALVLLPVFREVTLGGVTLKSEIEAIVQREVSKAQRQALELMAKRDIEMMPIWERENSSVPGDFSTQKVELLKRTVSDLERQWTEATPDDRVHFGLALRDNYWMYLAAARHHWASSMPYQDVWRRVEKGFAMLASVPHVPSR